MMQTANDSVTYKRFLAHLISMPELGINSSKDYGKKAFLHQRPPNVTAFRRHARVRANMHVRAEAHLLMNTLNTYRHAMRRPAQQLTVSRRAFASDYLAR